MCFGPDLHRALLQFLAALRGAGGLAVDGDDVVPRRVERGESRHRKGRRSHESDAHGLRLWRRNGCGASIPLPLRERERDLRACRSEEHTSELQSLMRISYAVFCLKKKTKNECHKDSKPSV